LLETRLLSAALLKMC